MSRFKDEEILKYFKDVYKDKYKDVLLENSVNSLVFSYLVGMPPEECKYMELESEMDDEQVEEYYEIEGIIHRLIAKVKE